MRSNKLVSASNFVLSRFLVFAFVFSGVAAAHSPTPQEKSQNPDASVPPPPAMATAQPSAAKITYSFIHVAGPYVAMTFDDGPNQTLTPKLLDLLAQRKMKATFFVLGENAQRYPEILKREFAEGHEIGNHSWSHPNLAKSSDQKVRDQLQRTDDLIFQTIGVHPKIMRPPYGSLTSKQRQWVHDTFHYNIILWDVDPLDWKEPGPAIVAKRIIAGARPGSIILSHDIHAQTIAAMPQAFDALLAKGYKFVTVSELIALQVTPVSRPPAATPEKR